MQSYLTLEDVADRAATLAVACKVCDRHGQYRLAALVRAHGRDKSIPDWLREISIDCPRRMDPGPSMTDLCGVHCPTLSEVFVPSRAATADR
jgi:hypothetical protein